MLSGFCGGDYSKEIFKFFLAFCQHIQLSPLFYFFTFILICHPKCLFTLICLKVLCKDTLVLHLSLSVVGETLHPSYQKSEKQETNSLYQISWLLDKNCRRSSGGGGLFIYFYCQLSVWENTHALDHQHSVPSRESVETRLVGLLRFAVGWFQSYK